MVTAAPIPKIGECPNNYLSISAFSSLPLFEGGSGLTVFTRILSTVPPMDRSFDDARYLIDIVGGEVGCRQPHSFFDTKTARVVVLYSSDTVIGNGKEVDLECPLLAKTMSLC